MPYSAVNAGRVHAQQYLRVGDRGPVDLLQAKHVLGRAVVVLDDRLHRRLLLIGLGRGPHRGSDARWDLHCK